jgi:hypothetical protein
VVRADEENNFFGSDFIVVTDSLQLRLVQLDRTGARLASQRVQDVGRGSGEFDYPAIDYYGSVYCSDRGGRLHKFDRELHYLLAIGTPGRGDYEFDEPRGLGLYRRFGQLFVAEREGAQYLWMGTDVFTPSVTEVNPRPDGTTTATVRYFLTEYSLVQLDLVDAAGTVRAPLQPSAWTPPGSCTRPVRWRLTDAPAGLRVRVQALPTYSSRKVLKVEKSSQPLVVRPRGAAPAAPR